MGFCMTKTTEVSNQVDCTEPEKEPMRDPESLTDYLNKVTTMAKNKEFDILRIVLGNTSCDLDSCVSSIALAYFYSYTTKNWFLPVINCDR
jgi:hypothetical protein